MPTPNAPLLWNIPYQRNPFFTGREEVLDQLHRALQAENTVALSHPQGISGLGGMGKTQTALEYAYRHRSDYDAVFWVRADSVTALTSGLVELACVLGLPECHEQDQRIIVEAVLRWLHLHPGWLLVFDNMDDLSVAEPFLPKTGSGHILFTTRAHALGGIAQRLEVHKMEPEIGALLLLRRASILPLQAPLDMAIKDDCSLACEISQQLDGLPLALDQAGAYIKETPCTLANYVSLYQGRRREILQACSSFNKDYPASVATTWSLSFEKVSQANAAAPELLDFCAFLAPDAIPEEMVTAGAQHLTPSLQMAAADPLQFDQMIAVLLAYSLIDRNANATLSIHRLVQAVLQDTMPTLEQEVWAERATLAVNAAFPRVNHDTWPQCERLLSQALAAAQVIEQYQVISKETGRLLHQTASYLRYRARYMEAEPLFQRALRIYEQQLGPENPNVAYLLTNLAILYREQGRYAEAESLYQRALRILEQQLGSEHPNVASPLTNLANLYTEQGRYAEAEPLYQQALRVYERQLGPEHPNVASPLHNLANLYREQGRYAEAEPLYQRALQILEQQLGPEHPNVASPLIGLGGLYCEQGRYAEAEPLFQRSLRIYEQQLGPEHPSVAYPLANLASLYREQGKYAESEQLSQRALSIREQALGPQHHLTAEVMSDLARIREAQGRSEEARYWYVRALTAYEQALGVGYFRTRETRRRLITLLQSMGQHEEAEQLEAAETELGISEEERATHSEE